MVKETDLKNVHTICSSGFRPLCHVTFREASVLLLQRCFFKFHLKATNLTAWAQLSKHVALVVLLAQRAHLISLAIPRNQCEH